ncbi:hypothetical protein N2152v2_006675 [Parachlorella kessleri]
MPVPGIGKLVGVNFGDKIDEHVLPVLDKLMDKLAAGVTKAKKKARGLLGGDPNKPPSAKSLEKAERKRRQRQQWHAENQEIARQCAKRLAPQRSPAPAATAICPHRPACKQPAADLPCSSESMEVPCISNTLADPCQAACQLTEEASCYQIVFEPWCCQLAAEPSYSQAMGEPSQPAEEPCTSSNTSSSSGQSLIVPCCSSILEQPSQPPQEPTLAHYIGEASSCDQQEKAVACSEASAEARALAEPACWNASLEEPSCSQPAEEACCRAPSQSLWPNIIWRQADRTRHSHLRSASCRSLLALSDRCCRVGVVYRHWTGSLSYTC